jgi:hypothetical protein
MYITRKSVVLVTIYKNGITVTYAVWLWWREDRESIVPW